MNESNKYSAIGHLQRGVVFSNISDPHQMCALQMDYKYTPEPTWKIEIGRDFRDFSSYQIYVPQIL